MNVGRSLPLLEASPGGLWIALDEVGFGARRGILILSFPRSISASGCSVQDNVDDMTLHINFGLCETYSEYSTLFWVACVTEDSYLVDPASSHMLVSKIKPCMCKYKLFFTVKLRMAH